ncbi:hypothetical protein ACO1CM_03690 [Staphylococcus saprophyticus]
MINCQPEPAMPCHGGAWCHHHHHHCNLMISGGGWWWSGVNDDG